MIQIFFKPSGVTGQTELWLMKKVKILIANLYLNRYINGLNFGQ